MQTSSMAQGPDMAIVFRAKEADMFQFDTNDLEKTLGLAVFKAAGFITVYLFFHYLQRKKNICTSWLARSRKRHQQWLVLQAPIDTSCLPAALPAHDWKHTGTTVVEDKTFNYASESDYIPEYQRTSKYHYIYSSRSSYSSDLIFPTL